MLQAISRVAKPLKPDLKRCISSNREIVEPGKNFLLWLDKANNGVEDVPGKVKGNSSSNGEEQNIRHEEDSDLSKLHRVVEEMGLSYFFVLEDVPDINQFGLKTSSGLSIPLREASQLLAELGFSSEDILSLQAQLKSDGSLDLQAVASFLFFKSPVHENATVRGSDLSKLLSVISFNSKPLHFSLDTQKEFSIEELRNILVRVLKLSDETRGNLGNAALDTPSKTSSSSETTFNDGIGPEDRSGVRQRDLKDAFARTVVGTLQTVERKKTSDQQDIDTGTEDYRVNTKTVNEKVVFVNPEATDGGEQTSTRDINTGAEDYRVNTKTVNEKVVFINPEATDGGEQTSTRDIKSEIRGYEEILKENYHHSVTNNPLNLNRTEERLFDYEMQARIFQSNPGDPFERSVWSYRYGNLLVDNGNVPNLLMDIGQNDVVKAGYFIEDLPLESDVWVHNNINRVNPSETLSDSGNGKSDQNFSFQTHGSDNIIQSKDTQDNPTNGIQGFTQLLAQNQESPAVSTGVGRIAIVAHVAEHLTQMKQLNQNRLVLQLDPPELGRVVIKVSVRDNKVSTYIATENEEIKDLLNRNTEFLRRYLEEQGLFLDEFSVETNVSNSGNHSGSKRDYKFSGSDSPTLLQSFTTKGGMNFSESTGSSVNENREHLIYLFA